jgi:hypothetical protein
MVGGDCARGVLSDFLLVVFGGVFRVVWNRKVCARRPVTSKKKKKYIKKKNIGKGENYPVVTMPRARATNPITGLPETTGLNRGSRPPSIASLQWLTGEDFLWW